MKKETAINSFKSGIQLDMNPLTIESDTLTDCLNGTIITNNGNEYMLQNDMGNGRVETAMLPSGYTPLGITSFGGIIYILSYNPLQDRYQFGSFPSPERNFSQDELTDLEQSITLTGIPSSGNINDFSKETQITIPLYQVILYDDDLFPGDKFKICANIKDLIFDAKQNYNENCIISGFSKENTAFNSDLYPRYIKFEVIGVMKNGSIINLTKDLTWTQLQEKDTSGNSANFYILPSGVDEKTQKFTATQLDEYRGVVNSQYDVFTSKYSGKLGLIAKYEAPSDFSVGCETIVSELYQECQDIKLEVTNNTTVNQTYVLYNNLKVREGETIKVSFYYRLKGMKLSEQVLTVNDAGKSVTLKPRIFLQLNEKYNWAGGNVCDDLVQEIKNYTGIDNIDYEYTNHALGWTHCVLDIKVNEIKKIGNTGKQIVDDYIYLRFDAVEFIEGSIEISNFYVHNISRVKNTHVPKLNLLEDTSVSIKYLEQELDTSYENTTKQTTIPIYQLPYQLGYLSKYEDNTIEISFKYKLSGFCIDKNGVAHNGKDAQKEHKSRISIQFSHDYGYQGINPKNSSFNNLFLSDIDPDDEGYYTFIGTAKITNGFTYEDNKYNEISDIFNERSDKYIYLRFVNTTLQPEEFGVVDIKDFKITRLQIRDSAENIIEPSKVIYSTKDDEEFKNRVDVYYNLNWKNNNKGAHKNRVNPKGLNTTINKKCKYDDILLLTTEQELKASDTLDNVNYCTTVLDKDFYKDDFNLESYLVSWGNLPKSYQELEEYYNNKLNEPGLTEEKKKEIQSEKDEKLNTYLSKFFNYPKLRKNNGSDDPYFIKGPSIKYNQSKYQIIDDNFNNEVVESTNIDFEFTPVMPFGELNYLDQKVSLDLSKLGTGYIELSKYQYFNDKDKCNLTFSFDTYLENNKKIDGLIINIYPFDKSLITETKKHGNNREYQQAPIYSTIIHQDFYNISTNHTINFGIIDDEENITFNKDDIYQVEFMIVYDMQIKYYYRVLHTSNIFNAAYGDVKYKDFADLYLYDKDQGKIGIDFNISLSKKEGVDYKIQFDDVNIQEINILETGRKCINFEHNPTQALSFNSLPKPLTTSYYYVPTIPKLSNDNIIVNCDVDKIKILISDLVKSNNLLFKSTYQDKSNIKTTKGNYVYGFESSTNSSETTKSTKNSSPDGDFGESKDEESGGQEDTPGNQEITPGGSGGSGNNTGIGIIGGQFESINDNPIDSFSSDFSKISARKADGYLGMKSYSSTYKVGTNTLERQNHWYISNNKGEGDVYCGCLHDSEVTSVLVFPKVLKSSLEQYKTIKFDFDFTLENDSKVTLFFTQNEIPIEIITGNTEFNQNEADVYNKINKDYNIDDEWVLKTWNSTEKETYTYNFTDTQINQLTKNYFRIGFKFESKSPASICKIDNVRIPTVSKVEGSISMPSETDSISKDWKLKENVYKTTVDYKTSVPIPKTIDQYQLKTENYTPDYIKKAYVTTDNPLNKLINDCFENNRYINIVNIDGHNYLLFIEQDKYGDSIVYYIVAEKNSLEGEGEEGEKNCYKFNTNSNIYPLNKINTKTYVVQENVNVYQREVSSMSDNMHPFVDFKFGVYLNSGEIVKNIKNLTLNNLNKYPISDNISARYNCEPGTNNRFKDYTNTGIKSFDAALLINNINYFGKNGQFVTTGGLNNLIQCVYNTNGKLRYSLKSAPESTIIKIGEEDITIYLYDCNE